MTQVLFRVTAAIAVCGSLATVALGRADDRSAEAILADIDAIKEPASDSAKHKTRAAVLQAAKKRKDAAAQKAKLIGELYRADPQNPKLVTLLPERWRALYAGLKGTTSAKQLTAELDDALASTQSDELKKEAVYWKARIGIVTARGDSAKVKAVDEFITLDPKDARGAELLAILISKYVVSPAAKTALSERLAANYADSSASASTQEKLPPSEAIGKPFVLEFMDAVSGSPVSTQRLKGKVVVVDFWATWCGPCVAEMPRMKALYAEYRNKGVQFIGVSLDQSGSGLDKLMAFVEENGITWPQYYQGDGWDSAFSKSWGIRSIPAVFVVDQQGKVYSDKARGKLETILPELLKRPAPKTGVGVGE
jgi:thiol-disulfide isomerase/thioredoxin